MFLLKCILAEEAVEFVFIVSGMIQSFLIFALPDFTVEPSNRSGEANGGIIDL